MPFRLPESSVLNLSKNICREEGSESRSAPATASRARYPSSTTAACRRCACRPATARSAHASAERYARTERLLGEPASQGAHTKRTHNAQPPARPHARLHIPACCRAPRGPTPPELPEGRSGLFPPSITPPRPRPRSSATEGALRAPLPRGSEPSGCRLTAAVARLCMAPLPPGRAQEPAAIETAPRGAPGRGRGLDGGGARRACAQGAAGSGPLCDGACAAAGGEGPRAPLGSMRACGACREGRRRADVSWARAPACRASRGEPVPAIRRRAPPRAAGTGSGSPPLGAGPPSAGGSAR